MRAIVITGGPCAGKTSALGVLRARFDREGIPAVFVPEAATDLILSGIAPWTCSSMLEFQTQVMALQVKREAEAFTEAQRLEASHVDGRGADVLVVFDRGMCDSHAYLPDDDYARALEVNKVDEAAALARYDAVFHLETVAKNHPDAYTRSNNEARFEDAAEAVIADERVIAAWSAHPHLQVIESEVDFDVKVAKLLHAIGV